MWMHVFSGLMSRCKTMAHAYKLCKMFGCKLTIIWPVDTECGIEFYDVFDEGIFQDIDFKVIQIYYSKPEQIPITSIRICPYIAYLHLRNWISDLVVNMIKLRKVCIDLKPTEEIGWTGEKFEIFTNNSYKKIFSSLENKGNVYVHAYNGCYTHEYFDTTDYRKVLFRKEYYDIVERIVGKRELIGLHIRRTDHEVAISSSPTKAFEKIISTLLSENENTFFFLATDDIKEQEYLLEKYPENIIVQKNKIWGRRSKESMESGIIDFLCLTKCSCIYGSYTSVFSHMAAEIGDLELHIVK